MAVPKLAAAAIAYASVRERAAHSTSNSANTMIATGALPSPTTNAATSMNSGTSNELNPVRASTLTRLACSSSNLIASVASWPILRPTVGDGRLLFVGLKRIMTYFRFNQMPAASPAARAAPSDTIE